MFIGCPSRLYPSLSTGRWSRISVGDEGRRSICLAGRAAAFLSAHTGGENRRNAESTVWPFGDRQGSAVGLEMLLRRVSPRPSPA